MLLLSTQGPLWDAQQDGAGQRPSFASLPTSPSPSLDLPPALPWGPGAGQGHFEPTSARPGHCTSYPKPQWCGGRDSRLQGWRGVEGSLGREVGGGGSVEPEKHKTSGRKELFLKSVTCKTFLGFESNSVYSLSKACKCGKAQRKENRAV